MRKHDLLASSLQVTGCWSLITSSTTYSSSSPFLCTWLSWGSTTCWYWVFKSLVVITSSSSSSSSSSPFLCTGLSWGSTACWYWVFKSLVVDQWSPPPRPPPPPLPWLHAMVAIIPRRHFFVNFCVITDHLLTINKSNETEIKLVLRHNMKFEIFPLGSLRIWNNRVICYQYK